MQQRMNKMKDVYNFLFHIVLLTSIKMTQLRIYCLLIKREIIMNFIVNIGT